MDILLQKLVSAFKVSGHEEGIRELIKEELKDVDCEIKEDKLGNLIVKVGSGNNKIMFTSNMDEIGLMVTYIEDNGNVKFTNVGELDTNNILNKVAIFNDGTLGVISCSDDKKEIENMYIDLGLSNKEDVMKHINEGDVAKIESEVFKLGNRISGTSLSNIANCYVLINLIKEIEKTSKECYFVFSSQGKLGGRGGRAAANQIKPDYVVVLSTEEVDLGKGPALIIKDKSLIMCHEIKELLEEAAKNKNIELQYKVSKDSTEGGLIHKEVGGIKTGVVALPIRYKNLNLEMIEYKDLENLKKLLKELV